MSGIGNLPTSSDGPGTLHVLDETPRGSRAKSTLGLLTPRKALTLGLSYPFAFGFIAHTKAENRGPFDVLLVTTADPGTSCVVVAKPIGVIDIEQSDPGQPWMRIDPLLAAPATEYDVRQPACPEVLSEADLAGIEASFIVRGERDNKELKIVGRQDATHALELVRQAQQ